MTILAFGSLFRRVATSSRIAFASLSTRHGRFLSGKLIEFSLLQLGGGGGTSIFTVQFPVPVKLRASVAVTVTVTAPACKPAVSRVAVVPVPLIWPELAL